MVLFFILAINKCLIAAVVVQSLSPVRLFATPRTAGWQASLSFTISHRLLTFMSIELVMPSKHLILCCPLLLLPLDCKEIEPVSPKGNQPGIFVGRTDAKTEASIFWPPDVKSQLIGKDPHAGKDWREKEKGPTKDEMVRQHHQINVHEFVQPLGDSEGQGSLSCCSPWGCNKSDATEQLNNNNNKEAPEIEKSLL